MEEKKRKGIDLIIEIVLVMIIVILLVHNCSMMNKPKAPSKSPTGNVDIIEITCEKECKKKQDNTDKKEDNTNDNNTSNNTNTNNNTNSNSENSDNKEEDIIEELEVFDEDKNSITWNGSADLKIFTNSMYTLEDVIAPESTNTYQFVVKNSTVYNLKYKIDFVETNPKNINMKYKLKKNDEYLIDHYVSYDELNITDQILNSSLNDTFYLEWKWVSSDNDTEIGKTGANYKLTINVNAEGYNG